MCLGRPLTGAGQRRIYDIFEDNAKEKLKTKWGNLPPTGDCMVPRVEGDGIFRVENHNIHGTGLGREDTVEEIDAVSELGMDAQGMCEINKPWTAGNK